MFKKLKKWYEKHLELACRKEKVFRLTKWRVDDKFRMVSVVKGEDHQLGKIVEALVERVCISTSGAKSKQFEGSLDQWVDSENGDIYFYWTKEQPLWLISARINDEIELLPIDSPRVNIRNYIH
jgi:hypothetical protein